MTRITPAHAGKRSWHGRSVKHHQDHPRTRGEKTLSPCHSVITLGSPPHTRGKGRRGTTSAQRRRITPAHAGKRGEKGFYVFIYQDHPRTRGEKPPMLNRWRCLLGSPPHTRGKAVESLLLISKNRITPAHAGKSQYYPKSGLRQQDHPRTRGEKHQHQYDPAHQEGSPPHTRGKADLDDLQL